MKPIPFKAALFDLDGTLLDSMYVWKRVDEIFFSSRGMEVPEDYSHAVAGMSYRETAMYTVEHYVPHETCESVIAEWTRLTELEYANCVPLKPGGLEYLRMLKRSGVKLAVATALPPNLYEPCLKRLGVFELFEVLCSTEQTGGRGKANGEVYLLAAKELGVEPEDCAVFEDVYTGIAGAKRVGMRAFCIRDAHSTGDLERIEAIADGMLDSLDDMRAYHDLDVPARCVIFTAHCDGDLRRIYVPQPDDFVLCADAGWKLAREVGVMPDLVIGDFDSSEAPNCNVIERHPAEKDDTDAMLCLKRGLALGYVDFLIIGGFGGRLDHTYANLQMLGYAAAAGAHAEMRDGHCYAAAVRNGTLRVARWDGKLSVFALSDRCEGVTIRGAKYVLEDAELCNTFPLGVSNAFEEDEAEISVREGTLLVFATDMQ